ncbi:MAG: hypothetical protein ABSE95_04560 [Thermodesulfobacteriota bacterium]|jgi:hypothetical protein
MRGDSDKRIIRGGGVWHVTTKIGKINDMELVESLSIKRLYYCGKVIYKDIMKNFHTTWFCLEYSLGSESFFRSDNDEMNDFDEQQNQKN